MSTADLVVGTADVSQQHDTYPNPARHGEINIVDALAHLNSASLEDLSEILGEMGCLNDDERTQMRLEKFKTRAGQQT